MPSTPRRSRCGLLLVLLLLLLLLVLEQVWPTKQDDFFPYASDPHAYWTGYFSSRPTSKFMIRQTEWMSSLLSKIAASKVVNTDTEEKLDSLRRTVGVVQHHDAATGTERQAVADDYRWIELFKYWSTFLLIWMSIVFSFG